MKPRQAPLPEGVSLALIHWAWRKLLGGTRMKVPRPVLILGIFQARFLLYKTGSQTKTLP